MVDKPMNGHARDVDAPTATEKVVASIWSDVLQRPEFDKGDNFYVSGGDSLTSMITIFRVGEHFRVELPQDALANAPTLVEFCSLVDRVLSATLANLNTATPG